MATRLISREALPPYSIPQWGLISRSKNVDLYEVDIHVPFKLLHNEVQKVVTVIDKEINQHIVTLLLEIVPYRNSNFEAATLTRESIFDSVLLLYNTIKINKAKVGVYTYVIGYALLEPPLRIDIGEMPKYISLSRLNSDLFKLSYIPSSVKMLDRTKELCESGIRLPQGKNVSSAAILLSTLVDSIDEFREEPKNIVPPVIVDADCETVGQCGDWSFAVLAFKTQSKLLSKPWRFCFYDDYENAYCAIEINAFNVMLIKYESASNKRMSLVDMEKNSEDAKIAKSLFYGFLTDSCGDVVCCKGDIDWKSVIQWCGNIFS